MYLYKSFTYLKTTHSYHLVDPSPWRAADRCARPFLTQETHLSSYERFMGKPLTRIFYLYTDYYLGLACQFTFLSTAGHTGKRIKKSVKTYSIEYPNRIDRGPNIFDGCETIVDGQQVFKDVG